MKEYIEREALLNEVEILKGVSPYYHRMKTMIEEAPVSDVAPVVHGEWKVCFEEPRLTSTSAGVSEFWFECSLCGRKESHTEPYCHCGARMDGGNK